MNKNLSSRPDFHKRKWLLCALTFFTLIINTQAQNLVPNPSFEEYTQCPTAFSQIAYCKGWNQYSLGTPDYFRTCGSGGFGLPSNFAGYQQAARGNAYAGINTYYPMSYFREYIHSQITPLQAGATYEVSMSVSFANMSGWAADNLGVCFFDSLPNIGAVKILPYVPQISYSSYGLLTDTVNWLRLVNSFVADSAYDNIVIGGFRDNTSVTAIATGITTGLINHTAYLYLDSIVVQQISRISINLDNVAVCPGDTLTVPYTISVNNYFNPGNVFTLQLSDTTGSFANPISIGSITSINSGTIIGIIPSNIKPHSKYRLRIIASSPFEISFINDKEITIRPSPSLEISSDKLTCNDSILDLTVNCDSPGVNYNWTGPANFTSNQQNPTIKPATSANAGTYHVTAELHGCFSKATTKVTVLTDINLTTNSNSPLCPGEDLILSASAPVDFSYKWTGPNSFISKSQNPVISKADSANSGSYIVTAFLDGCKITDSITVHVTCDPIAVPTGFSPNGDGHNDILFVRTLQAVKELDLRIYDRWGQLVFETRDINTGWDGTFRGEKLDTEAVAYVLTAVFKDGHAYATRGNITIIR